MKYKIGDKIRIIEYMVFFCEKNIGKVDKVISVEKYGIELEKYGTIPYPALRCIIKIHDNDQDLFIENITNSPAWE